MARKADRPRRPYVAEMHEVRITRSGEYASIEYLELGVESASIQFGEKLAAMTDQDILDWHNESIRAQNDLADELSTKPLTEVPLGSPQIEFHQNSGQWVPRGDVLRCVIQEDEEQDCQLPSIIIDGLELSLEEFGRMLLVRTGWGMRIEFVDEEETHRRPKVQVREPGHSGA
jgi:hypothetical protein